MASLTFARPGKVSERQYLGDLACLFDRQRQRSDLALTIQSFASDLAASDALRSALFTLCTAISRMGENDLSPEELLDLVARALCGAASAAGETGEPVPAEMREAFLSGYAQWQARCLHSGFGGSDDWLSDQIIPFPGRRSKTPEEQADGLRSEASIAEAYLRRRHVHAPNALAKDVAATDDRPAGIDALLAAAPVWASTTPPARSLDEEAFLSRNTPLSPQQLSDLIAAPMDARPNSAEAIAIVPVASRRSALEAEDIAPVSPLGRLQAFVMRLPPRKVFFALAGLTILAGAFAGVMAYRTLHTGRVLQFNDLEPSVAFAAAPATATPTAQSVTPLAISSAAPTVAAPVASTSGPALALRPSNTISLRPAVLDRAASQSSAAVLDIPAPTMIGYALATPQPATSAHADGGTVAVDIVISRLGDVISANAVSGPQQFYTSAVRAVRGWRFRPYLVDGAPVQVATTLQFPF